MLTLINTQLTATGWQLNIKSYGVTLEGKIVPDKYILIHSNPRYGNILVHYRQMEILPLSNRLTYHISNTIVIVTSE